MAITLATCQWANYSEWEFSGDYSDILFNQTADYIDINAQGGPYRYYNSAIFCEYYNGRPFTYLAFFVTKTPQTLVVKTNNSVVRTADISYEHTEGGTLYFTRQWADLDGGSSNGGIYCRNGNFGGFSTSQGDIVTNFGDIPVFTDLAEFIAYTQAPFVRYQWSSVPTISGKNGVLSLPVLIDTDGNPVSNGSASDFSTLPDSVKVRTLADLAVP